MWHRGAMVTVYTGNPEMPKNIGKEDPSIPEEYSQEDWPHRHFEDILGVLFKDIG